MQATTEGRSPKRGASSASAAVSAGRIEIKRLALTIVGTAPLRLRRIHLVGIRGCRPEAHQDPGGGFCPASLWYLPNKIETPSPLSHEAFREFVRKTPDAIGYPVTGLAHSLLSVAGSAKTGGVSRNALIGAVRIETNRERLPLRFQSFEIVEEKFKTKGKHPRVRSYSLGEFSGWSIPRVELVYNGHAISREQLLALWTEAGRKAGLGRWRPSEGGKFGAYTVKQIS